MGNHPPQQAKDRKEQAQWNAILAAARAMPRYVPIASTTGITQLNRPAEPYGGGVDKIQWLRLQGKVPRPAVAPAVLRCISTGGAGIGQLNHKILLAILVRLPRAHHEAVATVCAGWNATLRDGAFVKARRACPLTGDSCLERTLFIVGGRGVDYSQHGEGSMLDARGMWTKIAPLPEPVTGNSCVIAAGELYSLGGQHGNPGGIGCGCLLTWSPEVNRWRGGPLMHEARVLASIVSCRDKIYVLGGVNRMVYGNEVSSCERYDPATLEWEPLPPLYNDGFVVDDGEEVNNGGDSEDSEEEDEYERRPKQFCHSMGAAVVGGKIFVFGGEFDDVASTDRVLVFDTETNAWARRDPMPAPRSWPEAHAVGDVIYILGGGDAGSDDGMTSTTWRYDTVGDTWETLAPAPRAHSEIFARTDAEHLKSVPHHGRPGELCYHLPSDTWVVPRTRRGAGHGMPANPQVHTHGFGVTVGFLP